MKLFPFHPAARAAAALLACGLAGPAAALDYQTTGRAAILYDAPNAQASKVAVAGNGVPLEVVVATEAWLKVRDPNGRLAWIERAALGGARSVMVKVDAAAVRKTAQPGGDVAFNATRGVLLQVDGEVDAYGWLPVKHVDGMAGWIALHEVWGR